MGKNSRIFADPAILKQRIPSLSEAKIDEARRAALRYPFRITEFYLQNVLNGRADDPLLDVILPTDQESDSFQETWDANQTSADIKAIDSPLWSQKYPYEGVIRLTTECSSLCRYCYVREQTNRRRAASPIDIANIFEQLSHKQAADVREVIVSGGDPLMASPSILRLVGSSVANCNERRVASGMNRVIITIHTREPVWRPDHFLANWSEYKEVFSQLDAYAFVFQVIHPREVTSQFQELTFRITRAGRRTPLMLVQHPIFRGINDTVMLLAELYGRLAEGPAAIKPYYLVHGFDSGTLQKHRISLPETQAIVQSLGRYPGIQVPTLVVPTPLGKAIVSPFQPLVQGSSPGRWKLFTKNGVEVDYVDLALANNLVNHAPQEGNLS
jgi:lysine 2,3-aminomutase